MSSKNLKTLQELCRELEVTRRAVQGYEKAGLVSATSRNKYGHLLYDEKAQKRIEQIRQYQQMDFSIREIKELINAPAPVVREAIGKQVVHMEEKQRKGEIVISKAKELMRDLK